MTHNCPNKQCDSHAVAKDGSFFRKSDSRKIQRFKCPKCKTRFSAATNTPEFGQNKRRLNEEIRKLLSSTVGVNQMAYNLGTTSKTISRKLVFLGEQCRIRNQKLLSKRPKISNVQFDELITIEHTKLKPLAVAMAVEEETRLILGVQVSKTPATGKISQLSIKKYGPRKCEKKQGLKRLFEEIKPHLADKVNFSSDEYSTYPGILKAFSKRNHRKNDTQIRHLGREACDRGQGELKKGYKDPLFSINHSFAMLRARVNRLIRRSWNTTKKVENLLHHLNIYIHFHNQRILMLKC
jgi:transposase-like protein